MAKFIAGHPVDDVALAVDEKGALHLGTRRDDGIVRSHPAQDVERRPAHVDLVAARHKRRGALEAAQPVSGRQRRPSRLA